MNKTDKNLEKNWIKFEYVFETKFKDTLFNFENFLSFFILAITSAFICFQPSSTFSYGLILVGSFISACLFSHTEHHEKGNFYQESKEEFKKNKTQLLNYFQFSLFTPQSLNVFMRLCKNEKITNTKFIDFVEKNIDSILSDNKSFKNQVNKNIEDNNIESISENSLSFYKKEWEKCHQFLIKEETNTYLERLLNVLLGVSTISIIDLTLINTFFEAHYIILFFASFFAGACIIELYNYLSKKILIHNMKKTLSYIKNPDSYHGLIEYIEENQKHFLKLLHQYYFDHDKNVKETSNKFSNIQNKINKFTFSDTDKTKIEFVKIKDL